MADNTIRLSHPAVFVSDLESGFALRGAQDVANPTCLAVPLTRENFDQP